MHTPESLVAEVEYRRERAQHSWPAHRESVRRRRRVRYADAADPAPGITLPVAFADLLRLIRYRSGRWATGRGVEPDASRL